MKAGRVVALGCTMPVLIISFTFCGLYWGMWTQAQDANDHFSGILPAVYTDDYPYYDTCGGGILLETTDYSLTGWGVILAYASILYLILGIFTVCLALSFYVNIFACCAVCGHCWGQCAHFALIIVTGVFRFSESGDKCAERTDRIMLDDDTTW